MNMRSCLWAILVLLFMVPNNAHCADDSAEQHVKRFYQWYIKGEGVSIYKDERKEIYQYVDGCLVSTLEVLYSRGYFDVGYYTKSQDLWQEWLDVMIVHKEIKINDTTSVVPVSFKWSEDKQHHLLVFVRKEVAGWRIIKVSTTDRFYE